MAWKIIFTYVDGDKIKVSNKHKVLPLDLARTYQSRYASPSNNGGMVQISPYKDNPPVPLNEYIEKLGERK